MEFPKTVHEDPAAIDACREAGIFDRDFYWKHSNGYNQHHLDALTADLDKALSAQFVLWDSKSDAQQPVHETDVHNASPGSLPKVQAFVATHAEYGTKSFYPVLASKGGPVDAFKEFVPWTAGLNAAAIALLKDMDYFVQPGAKLTKAGQEGIKRMREEHEGINPKNWLVRPVTPCLEHSAERAGAPAPAPHPATAHVWAWMPSDLVPTQPLAHWPNRGQTSPWSTSSLHASAVSSSRATAFLSVWCSLEPCTSTANMRPLVW